MTSERSRGYRYLSSYSSEREVGLKKRSICISKHSAKTFGEEKGESGGAAGEGIKFGCDGSKIVWQKREIL